MEIIFLIFDGMELVQFFQNNEKCNFTIFTKFTNYRNQMTKKV
jgi:hypothetical protein